MITVVCIDIFGSKHFVVIRNISEIVVLEEKFERVIIL